MTAPRTLSALMLLAATAAAPVRAQERVELPARDRPLEGTPRTLYSVGAAEGAEWEMFDGVRAVAFDAEDNLYLLDRGNARVLVFDRAGRFVRQIGRKGPGPGELQLPMAMTLTADGTVVVADVGRGGYSLFSREGAFLRNVLSDPSEGRIVSGRIAATPAGGILYQGSPLRRGEPGQPPQPSDSVDLFWHPLAEGARPATAARVPTIPPEIRTTGSPSSRRVSIAIGGGRTFEPTVRWTALAGGELAVAHDAAYALTVFGRDGRADRVIRRGIRPRAVTEKDRELARERRREAMRGGAGMVAVRVENGRTSTGAAGPASEERIRQSLMEMEFAGTIPVIRALAADPRGRLWIQRAGSDPFGPGPVDLVTGTGRYVGTLEPQALPDAFGRSGRAAYVETDPELGIQRVVVKQLPAGW